MDRAMTPNKPLKKRTCLLFPKGEIFKRPITTKLSTKETKLLNKTNSVTGKSSNHFTHNCISENEKEDINMYCTALLKKYSVLEEFNNIRLQSS